MSMNQPPYPTEGNLKATKAVAIVAFLIICGTLIALAVMIALHVAGVVDVHPATYLAVFFGGIVAVIVTVAVGARKKPGRARNITGQPTRTTQILNSANDTLAEAERIRDDIGNGMRP